MIAAQLPLWFTIEVQMPDDMSHSERRALLIWRLAHGYSYTTCEVAELLAVSPDRAGRYLRLLSRVIPVYFDDPEDTSGPRWQAVN